MKLLATISLILALLWSGSSSFEEAANMFRAKKYTESISVYRSLLSNSPEQQGEIRYNMAQIYLLLDSTQLAASYFTQATENGQPATKSLAHLELGSILLKNDKKREALDHFLKAVKANPYNESARYNYELLKKQLKDDPEDETPPEPEEDDNNLAQDFRKKFNYYLPPPDNIEGLPTLHQYDSIPTDEALKLLEDLKQQEVRFLQQLRKSAKPDAQNANLSQW